MRPQATQSATILYLEDDPNDFALFCRAVQRTGLPIKILGATDVAQALSGPAQQDHSFSPNALLLHLQPGNANAKGLELLRLLGHNLSTTSIPILLLTDSDHPYPLDHASQFGALPLFHKPDNDQDWPQLVADVCHWVLATVPSPLQHAA